MAALCWCILGFALTLQYGLALAGPLDPCQSSPCQNGGICTNTGGTYECACSEGTYGTDCENTAIIVNDPTYPHSKRTEKAADKTSEDSLKMTTSQTATDTSNDTFIDTSNDTFIDTSNDTSTDTPKDTFIDTSNDTSTDTPNDTFIDTSNDTSTYTPNDTFIDTSNDTSTDTTNDTFIDTSNDTSVGAPGTVAEPSNTTPQDSLQSTVEPSVTSSDPTVEAMDTSQTSNETADGRNDSSFIDQMTTNGFFIDPCFYIPCSNNGVCIGLPNGENYTCICMSGYTGSNCETQVINANNQTETQPPTSPDGDQDQLNALLVLLRIMKVDLCTFYSLCPDGFTCYPLDRGYQCELPMKTECKDNCSEPFEWTDCMCLKTCNDMANPSSATECLKAGDVGCQKGCQCPDGMVMHNNTCISGTDCPCYYEGNFFQLGDVVPSITEMCASLTCTATGMTRTIDTDCSLNVF